MYRRKIGKKIFRRTRKHKFYGIKVKKGPSILTRKRIRRGGEGETVIIQGIQETDPSIILSEKSCNDFAVRADDIAEEAIKNRNEYKFSDKAKEDIKNCFPLLGETNIEQLIADNVSTIRESRAAAALSQQNPEPTIQGEMALQAAKNQEEAAEALSQQNLETIIDAEMARRAAINEQEAIETQKIYDTPIMKNLIGDGFTNFPIEKLEFLIPLYMILENRSNQVYKIIFAILMEIIKFKDIHGAFIEKLSKDLAENIYNNIIDLLYYLIPRPPEKDRAIPSFSRLYNSFVKEDGEHLKYNIDGGNLKKNLPKFFNMNDVLRILYEYYDIIMLTRAQYYVLFNVYSYQLENIDVNNKAFLKGDKFNLIPKADDFKISNDEFLKFLLTDFVIDKETTILRKKITIAETVESLGKLIQREVNIIKSNESLIKRSESVEEVFLSKSPTNKQLTILKSSNNNDDLILKYFNSINWAITFLSGYVKIFCFKSNFLGTGLTTSTDVRDKITDGVVKPNMENIKAIIDNGKIFKNTQMEDLTNLPELNGERESIAHFIVSILNDNTKDNTDCNKSYAFTQLIHYSNTKSKSVPNYHYLCIFCNMVIYACYMSLTEKKKWGETGTDLMILYMNIFIIKYLKHLLDDLSGIITPVLASFLGWSSPIDTYILYGLEILSSLDACKKIREYFLILKNTIDENYKNSSSEFNKQITTILSDTIIPLEESLSAIVTPYNNRNIELLKTKELTDVLCANKPDFGVVNEIILSLPKPPPSSSPELKEIILMNKINLHRKVIDICREELIPKLLSSHTTLSESERKDLLDKVEILSGKPEKPLEHPNYDIDEERKRCELVVAQTINMARTHKGPPLRLTQKQIHDINVCAINENLFKHQKKNPKEFNKRIARSYYGIKEILGVCDQETIDKIKNSPNVKQLYEYIEKLDNVKGREMVYSHCNDDYKRVFGFLNQTRELIKADLSNNDIKKKCIENLKHFETLDSSYEVNWLMPQQEREGEIIVETLADLNNKKKNLIERLARSKRIITEARKLKSDDVVTMFKGRQTDILGKIRTVNEKIIAITPKRSSSWWRRGGSKRRNKTIKRRMHQQKQYKTKKYGRKYRASRPNKKTRKHLVRGRGRGRGHPHRRTRSH